MAKTTSVNLGDHFERFVGNAVDAGHYGNVSEVIRAGLRLLEEREAKFDALRQALRDGETSGPGQAFDRDTFRKEMLARHDDL